MDSKEPTTADVEFVRMESAWRKQVSQLEHDHFKDIEKLQSDNETLTRELGKANKAADKLEQGIQKYLDGVEPKQLSSKFAGCIHRNLNYQGCGQCIDDYFSQLLEGAKS